MEETVYLLENDCVKRKREEGSLQTKDVEVWPDAHVYNFIGIDLKTESITTKLSYTVHNSTIKTFHALVLSDKASIHAFSLILNLISVALLYSNKIQAHAHTYIHTATCHMYLFFIVTIVWNSKFFQGGGVGG